MRRCPSNVHVRRERLRVAHTHTAFQTKHTGIGLVLLLGLPLKLNNQQIEAGLPCGLGEHWKFFGKASLKRSGYTKAKIGFGEASGVLDL